MTMNAAGMARQLRATRQGNNWRCACPCGCGYSLSLADGEDGRLLAFCFGGCEFDRIMLALVEYGLLDDDDDVDLHVSPSVTVCQRDETQRIAQARQIYSSGIQDERIAVYLRSRGIRQISPVLRFAEQAPHRLGARLPAMLAPIVDAAGEQIGVHLTYLSRNNGGKTWLPKEFQRECRGVVRGGAIRLLPFNPDVELLLCEGVETALAAAEIFVRPAWSGVYAGGLRTVVLPPDVRRVIIAADNDASGAGQRNALAAYDRWRAEGRLVRIVAPPVVGDDSTMCCSWSPSMSSVEKPDVDGAEKFDADPEAWRKQFWGNDAGPGDAKAATESKGEAPRAMVGASPIWACCGCGGGRRRHCRSRFSARPGNNGFLMRPTPPPARSTMSPRRSSRAPRR
jgi:hypothetical protein